MKFQSWETAPPRKPATGESRPICPRCHSAVTRDRGLWDCLGSCGWSGAAAELQTEDRRKIMNARQYERCTTCHHERADHGPQAGLPRKDCLREGCACSQFAQPTHAIDCDMDEDCRCPEPGLFDALDIRGVEYVREVQDTGFEPYYEVTFGAGDTLCIDPATGRKFYSMRFGR